MYNKSLKLFIQKNRNITRLTSLIIFVMSIAVYVSNQDVFSEEEIQVLERSEDFKNNIKVDLIKKVKIPKGYHEDLLCDGNEIWICNGKGIDLWKVNKGTGEIVSEIMPVGSFTEAIALQDGINYWMTDWEDKKLYLTEFADEKIRLISEIDLDPMRPTGIINTGSRIFMLTWLRSLSGTRYFLMELDDEGRTLNEFIINDIHEPAHMTWDGQYIWITSWYDPYVYKVDINRFLILGSFKSPADKTTGIAWDGSSFWVTGTYDDLYNIQLTD